MLIVSYNYCELSKFYIILTLQEIEFYSKDILFIFNYFIFLQDI